MKENKMGNIWHALMKYILHIFIEKLHSNFHPTSFSKTEEGGPNNFAEVTNFIEIALQH